MKQKTILFLCVGIFCVAISFAQTAHNTNCMNCKLSKSYIEREKEKKEGGVKSKGRANDFCVCPACSEKDKKEREAKQAEEKRRADIANAKYKAEKEARDKAYAEEQRKKQQQAKSGEVVINAQPSSANTMASETPKKAKEVDDKTIFAKKGGRYNSSYNAIIAFKNENDEIIIESSDWSAAYLVSDISFTDIAVKNYGVVRIGDKNFSHKDYSYNLVNAKGEYLIDDNAIWSIQHLRDNWFLISSRANKYYVLNLKTKQKINLPYFAKQTQWHTFHNYPPAFSDKVAMNNYALNSNDGFWGTHSMGASNRVKKKIMEHFPDKVSEDVLGRYSFVLFHSDYYYTISDLSTDRGIMESTRRIEMYGITNDGKMETIRIK